MRLTFYNRSRLLASDLSQRTWKRPRCITGNILAARVANKYDHYQINKPFVAAVCRISHLSRVPPSPENIVENEAWLLKHLEKAKSDDYFRVLQQLAVSKLPDAPLRAERWLMQLEQSHTPTPDCYECVIRAWAAASHEDPARVVIRAERWLWKQTNPNTACFNAFLDACSLGRGLKTNRKLVRNHAIKAQETLLYMLRRNVPCTVDTFNFVIRAWTRCRSSPDVVERVMEILNLFEIYQRSVDSSVMPNSRSYAMVLDAVAVKIKVKVNKLRSNPNDHSHSDPSENGLEEIKMIEGFLREPNDLYQNANCYNTLIQAWANAAPVHSDAPFQAEQVLQRLVTLQDGTSHEKRVDAVSYQLVMRTWLNSGKPNRGKRIRWWLKQLWKEYDFAGRPPELRPTTGLYNIVIRVFSDLGQPLEAEDVFEELQGFSDEYLVPNSESYNTLIRSWVLLAEKGSEEALQNAVRWLRVLIEAEKRQEMGLSTSVDVFSSVLTACRQCAGLSPSILDLAIEVFDHLRESHHVVDSLHYSRLLQVGLLALSRSEHDETRGAFVKQLFRDCCNDGHVSRPLIQELADGRIYSDGWTADASAQMVEELFPDWPLPSSWTRNVRQEGLIPRRHHLRRRSYFVSRHRGPMDSTNHEDALETEANVS